MLTISFLLAGIKNYTYICTALNYHNYAHTIDTIWNEVLFYLDEHEPIHVHIDCNGKKAKILLIPNVKIEYNHGLKEQELKRAMEICSLYRNEFIKEWHKRFDENGG